MDCWASKNCNIIAKEVFEDIEEELVEGQNFGIDWCGPAPYDSSDETVNVPETPNPLNRADMAELKASISHQEPSMHYGIEIYKSALHFCFFQTWMRTVNVFYRVLFDDHVMYIIHGALNQVCSSFSFCNWLTPSCNWLYRAGSFSDTLES